MNIVAGTSYLALVEAPKSPVLDAAERLVPAKNLAGAARLRDFHDRFLQELRRLKPAVLAVVHTRAAAGWVYAQAFDRISLEAAMMLAASEAGVRCESVGQEASAKAVGVPLPKLQEKLAGALGIESGKYWKERCLAVAGAVAAIQGNVR